MSSDTDFSYYQLPNGLRLVHKRTNSEVAYAGFMVNTGTRDEAIGQCGMAHFVEHALFKGTEKRTSSQIINRIEDVGGELNAYTTKEDTTLYASMLDDYLERALDLMADMLFHSTFPATELKKEMTVVLEEIQSYKDNPSEQIYDDFEALLFSGHALEHAILGDPKSLRKFTSTDVHRFVDEKYNSDQIVLFVQSRRPFAKIVRLAEKVASVIPFGTRTFARCALENIAALQQTMRTRHHQTHFVCGTRSYSLQHPDRLAMYLLTNILGGQGMNSRLNMALRERKGLVYTVEGNYAPMSDTGLWTIYFGCDADNYNQCLELMYKELRRLREQPLSDTALRKYKQQLCGQMAIAAENQENNALAMAKSHLYYGQVKTWRQVMAEYEKIDALQLQRIANEMFDEQRITSLKYE